MDNQADSAAVEVSPDQMKALASCLLDYLKIHGRNGRTFDVLNFIACETIRCLDEGRTPRFNNLAIQSGVMHGSRKDPCAWLSPIWNKIADMFPEREEGLQRFSAQKGLDFFPWVAKLESDGGAGNQALHYLVALPIPPKEESIFAPTIDLPPPDIAYIPAEKIKPSWWGRVMFSSNLAISGWRKGVFLWPTLIWLLVIWLLGSLLFFALSLNTKPFSASDLLAIIFVGLMVWYCRYMIRRFVRFIDDRMVMASDSLIGIGEFGVCMELFKPQNGNPEARRSIRLIKYAARCPICDSEVLLDDGEPDFPRRIVGRCQESPREHVFSFDRVRLAGYRLRP